MRPKGSLEALGGIIYGRLLCLMNFVAEFKSIDAQLKADTVSSSYLRWQSVSVNLQLWTISDVLRHWDFDRK